MHRSTCSGTQPVTTELKSLYGTSQMSDIYINIGNFFLRGGDLHIGIKV